MLMHGHKGEKVKELQRLLRKEGLFDHKKDTGFYGPKTAEAVARYQHRRGIKIDGIYGPRTKDMLEGEEHARALINSPYIQGTKHQAILKALYGGGHHAINLGKGGLHVTPGDVVQKVKNIEETTKHLYQSKEKRV